MNKIDTDYQNLLKDILENGVVKETRNGGTISVFSKQIRHKMSEGFPLLTTKKLHFKSIVTELLWFLRGDTNIKYLVDNDCHIWDGDCYANYLKKRTTANKDNVREPHTLSNGMTGQISRPFTKEEFINKIKTDDEFARVWGELGPIYGRQWRGWDAHNKWDIDPEPIDQIQNLINDLKRNPDSRRMMVSAWNVGEIDSMVLPPCHYGFQVYTRELSLEERIKTFELFVTLNTHEECDNVGLPKRAISLMWNQRSVDTFLGLPFNIASYGLLLEIIAKAVNMVPDELIGNLGDVHLYSNHIEQAKEQIGRKYTPEEREIMLKDAMSRRLYNKAVNELMPFGGGMSEYYEAYKIPNRTREPFPLPKLVINSGNENWHLLNIDEIINTFDTDITFKVDGYQSHLSIKAPLSN
jgi:thymidylate synthase